MENIQANFDTTTEEGQIKIFNATSGSSLSIKDIPEDEVLTVDAVMVYEDHTVISGQENLSKVTTLFTTDGRTFGGVSDPVAKSALNLIGFFKATGRKDVDIQIIKGKSNQNREFFNIKIVK